MKVDLVVTFYRRSNLWEKVLWGIRQNAESISKVIVISDEPWGEWLPYTFSGMPLELSDHLHDGFGVSKSHNQGHDMARSRYVAHIDDDVVLSPGAITKNLKKVGVSRLIFGMLDEVVEDFDPDDPKFLRRDRGLGKVAKEFPHFLARGGFFICHRDSYQHIGGWDQRMNEYGYQDYEFTLRWMQNFGLDSVYLCPGRGWHITDPKGENMERRAAAESPTGTRFQSIYQSFMAKQAKGIKIVAKN